MITILGTAVNIYGVIMVLMNVAFLIGLWRELVRHNLDWSYLITRDGKRVSATKILQLVGGLTGRGS